MINLIVFLLLKAIKTCFFLGVIIYCTLFGSLLLVSDYRVYPGKPHRIERKAPFHAGQPLMTVLGAVGKDIFWNLKQAGKDFSLGYRTKRDVNNIASFGGVKLRTYTDDAITGMLQSDKTNR